MSPRSLPHTAESWASQPQAWCAYLNKGTHEEANRDDFDADLVDSVVRTLEEVDALDLCAG